jgi:hypothetical protein
VPQKIIQKDKVNHKKNLFEQFTTYIYYHANKWFDPHPRLFLECSFYNKDMLYINSDKVLDGSWYRWHDIQERGIEDRTLTENDDIVSQLI